MGSLPLWRTIRVLRTDLVPTFMHPAEGADARVRGIAGTPGLPIQCGGSDAR